MRCAPAVEVRDEVYTPPAVNIASYILVLEYIQCSCDISSQIASVGLPKKFGVSRKLS